MTIDFREQAGGNVRPFRYFTQTVLPAVYDDSLSYMELVAKTIEYLNEVIESLNANNAAVTEMQGLLEQYKQYMDDYFENLDVQEEIDNKLDAMVANGTLATLMQPIIAQLAPTTIQEWLDEHPEATTTVEDGSITRQKLSESLANDIFPIYVSSDTTSLDKARFLEVFKELYIVGGDGSERITTMQVTDERTRFVIQKAGAVCCYYNVDNEKKTGFIEIPEYAGSGIKAYAVVRDDVESPNYQSVTIILGSDAYIYTYSPVIEKYLLDNLEQRVDEISPYYERYSYATLIDPNVLTGLYVVKPGWKVERVRADDTMYRLGMTDGTNTLVEGQNVAPEYYSDLVQRFVDTATGEIIAYYILHYTGENYYLQSASITLNEHAYSLEDNHVISEYLNRAENLVLIGDSIFGYQSENMLEALLGGISEKQVFNCAFGGCRMTYSNAQGSGTYDPFAFPSVADAIAADDFTALKSAATSGLNAAYPYRAASLESVDFSKPTTIMVNYVNNDITVGAPIGDEWDYEAQAANLDKTTLLGAFNYGVDKILTAYPHVRIVEFTSAWRKLGTNAVPPYAYVNSRNLSPMDYNEAIISNAEKLGISVYDFFKNGGRNWYNTSTYQVDNSHYNVRGYKKFSEIINAVDLSYKA